MKAHCEGLPDDTAAFVERSTGCRVVAVRVERAKPGATRTFECALEDGRSLLAAWFMDAGKFVRELHALEALHDDPRVPNLVGVDHQAHGVLVERLPGVRASSLHLDDDRWPEVMSQAGAWLASLHTRAVWHVDAMPLADAYRARIEPIVAWLAQSDVLPAFKGLEDRLRAIPDRLVGRTRVPCHRDFTPDNWLLLGDTWVGVVDFEHARSDLAEAEVARLMNDGWTMDVSRWDAFRMGYQTVGGPGDLSGDAVAEIALLEALTTLAWALRHGDEARERSARAALAVRHGIPDGDG